MKNIEDFKVAFPGMYENVRCGFSCPAGWVDLVWELSERIYSILVKPENESIKNRFRVEQVKEKFGGLRFYTNECFDPIDDLINDFQVRSIDVCEICGKIGTRRTGGWIKTLCNEHANGREVYEENYN